MRAHKFVFILLILGGLLTSYIIKPRKQELAYMYLKAGKLEVAQSLYEDMYQGKVPNRNILVPLKQVYLAQGHVGKAVQLYERYVKQNPEDIRVLVRLASLYRDTFRYYDYMRVLERIYTSLPSTASLYELSKLYIRFGMKQKAIVSLKTLLESDPERYGGYQQLIGLQTSVGDYAGAEKSLTLHIASDKQMTPALAELRLRLLLSTGRTKEAFDWAKNWLDESQNDALRFAALLYSGGSVSSLETALETNPGIDPDQIPIWLVDTLVQAASVGNKTGFLQQFTSHLSEEKQQKYPVIMARLALIRKDLASLNYWLEKAEQTTELESEQQVGLTLIFLKTGRTDRAMELLPKLFSDSSTPVSLFDNLATEILKSGDIDKGLVLYEEIRRSSKNMEINYPWALLAAAQGKQEVAEWLRDENSGWLNRQQLMNIYYVAADRSEDELALDVATQVYARFDDLEGVDLLARSMMKMNKMAEVESLLRDYKDQSTELEQMYEQALIEAWKLDATLTDEIVSLWKKRLKTPDLTKKYRRQLAFQLLQAGEKQAAIDEFRRMAETEGPTGKNVSQLLFVWRSFDEKIAIDWLEGRARKSSGSNTAKWWELLIQAGGSARVLSMATGIGEDLFNQEQNSKLLKIYEQLLTDAWQQDDKLLGEIVDLWKHRLQAPNITIDTRRQLAFQLLQVGEKSTAIDEFRRLAQMEGPAGKNVRQLLYIWGPFPGDSALDWLENRAQKAPVTDIAGWWTHLVQAGGGARVVVMAEKMDEKLLPEAKVALIDALISIKDITGLKSHLHEQASKADDLRHLEKLAKTARAEGLSETEEYIWTRVIKIDPGNLRANRWLGLAAFSQGNRYAAEKYLKQYLSKEVNDWESNFYLAEVMYADHQKKAAMPYYERSLAQIVNSSKSSQRLRMVRALIYYRTGRKKEATTEYDKLVERFPADMALRAEYANILIEDGQLEKARYILGDKK